MTPKPTTKTEKVMIKENTTFSWDCPKCDEYNEIEYDGDCFRTPLKCDSCNEEFDDYEKDF